MASCPTNETMYDSYPHYNNCMPSNVVNLTIGEKEGIVKIGKDICYTMFLIE